MITINYYVSILMRTFLKRKNNNIHEKCLSSSCIDTLFSHYNYGYSLSVDRQRVLKEKRCYAFQGLTQTNEWVYGKNNLSSKSQQEHYYIQFLRKWKRMEPLRLLSLRLVAHFHLEKKIRSILSTLALVYGAHSLLAVCFVIMFPLPYILFLSRSFCLFFVASIPRHWKLLMLSVVVAVIIITAVDQYECGKKKRID
jgi:hypothetical protein